MNIDPEKKRPSEYDAIIEQAIALDQAYFQTHPKAEQYYRAALPGECWPFKTPKGLRVRVRQIASGVRVREFLPLVGVRWEPIPGFETQAGEVLQRVVELTESDLQKARKAFFK